MKKEQAQSSWINRVSDRHVYLGLLLVCVASRLPFLGTFELVAYDGTYYLNQARTLFNPVMDGTFPIGYPLVVRIFQVVLRDYQVAGMVVSFLAGVGSAILAYHIAARFVRRELALFAALAVAINPLFVRLSLMTLSESLYVFWVLLGLLMFIRQRWLPFGLAMGMAAITRPEALAIVGLLGLTRVRHPRQLAVIAVSFLAVYSINTIRLSTSADHVVLLPKSEFFGSSTGYWKMREAAIDFENADATFEQLAAESEERSAVSDYFKRLPVELRTILRYLLPATFLLALYALRRRKYLFMAAALVSFFVIPLATVRTTERYLLPYLPILTLLAVFAAAGLRNRTARTAAFALMAASIIMLPFLNVAALIEPEDPGLEVLKKAGIEFRGDVKPGDRIADRKPYFAFYSGGDYLEIPVAPYEDLMNHFTTVEKARFLVLHQKTIHTLRPALRPLMYSKAVINGELRFRQVYFDPKGVMVFQRVLEQSPLRWTRVTPPGGTDFAPAWSPDGSHIAFRSRTSDGAGGIYVIETGGLRPRKIADAAPLYDQLSWSPDGGWIAYADGESGAADIYAANVETGEVRAVVTGDGDDMSPSWSPAGGEIAFSSTRSGQAEIWITDPSGSAFNPVTTDGDNSWPMFSPSGDLIAWIKEDQGVVLFHGPTRERIQLRAPRLVQYAPAWSPDEKYIIVTAEDWGSWDIYLMKADGTNALLLTTNPKRDAMPAWSPDGMRIALVSDAGQKSLSIWTIEGLRPYIERLESKERNDVFNAQALR
jgi:TolB protein